MKIYSLAILASAATALSVATNLSNTTSYFRECFNRGMEKICCQDDEMGVNVCKNIFGEKAIREDCYRDDDGKFACNFGLGE